MHQSPFMSNALGVFESRPNVDSIETVNKDVLKGKHLTWDLSKPFEIFWNLLRTVESWFQRQYLQKIET